jgi:hypothetical protein
MSATFNIIRLFTFVIFTSLASTAFSGSPNSSGPPDFSPCDGLMGAAKGLCHAGIAVGCDQEASTACEQIEEQYTAKTGNEPPWVDRTIYINAESGEARPLDGMWEFGCDNDGPGTPDENEYMVFMGDTFQAWELEYTSTDRSCTTGEKITIFETGTVAAFDNITVGWEGDIIPMRLADDGLYLSTYPVVTKLIISITTGDEPGDYNLFYYMDDTGELASPEPKPWCIYAPWEEEDDDDDEESTDDYPSFLTADDYPSLLTAEEPRCKI